MSTLLSSDTKKNLSVPPKLSLKEGIDFLRHLPSAPLETITKYQRKLGDFYTVNLFNQKIEMITDPDSIRHIMLLNNKNYVKAFTAQEFKDVLGNGLLTNEGASWLRQRRLIQPAFHKQRLKELAKIMTKQVKEHAHRLEIYHKANQVVDMSVEMMELALKVVGKALFSKGIDETTLARLENGLNMFQNLVIIKIRQPYLIPFLYLAGKRKEYDTAIEDFQSISTNIIQERIKSGEKANDLLSILLDSRYEETGEGMSLEQLRDECKILLVAGYETSANALSWIWYMLYKHPEVEAKVLEEIQRVVGTEEVNFSHLPQLVYTRQVIDETLRLYPPAWITDRKPLEDDVVGGYPIPKGTNLNLFIHGVHHHPKYWPDPEKFDPDRFSKENKANIKPFSYLPFGGGPRLCIGNNFALYEMLIIMATFLPRFKFVLHGVNEVQKQPLITLRPKGGMPMKIMLREG